MVGRSRGKGKVRAGGSEESIHRRWSAGGRKRGLWRGVSPSAPGCCRRALPTRPWSWPYAFLVGLSQPGSPWVLTAALRTDGSGAAILFIAEVEGIPWHAHVTRRRGFGDTLTSPSCDRADVGSSFFLEGLVPSSYSTFVQLSGHFHLVFPVTPGKKERDC